MEGFFTREQLKKVASVHIDKTETDCLRCGLYAKCDSPKMKYHGEGLLKCLLLAEAPGAQEDKYNTQLIGPTGDFLKKKLLIKGFHLKRDFYRINAVNCRPFNPKDKTNRTPSPKEIECCRPSVMKTIEELQPKFIWLMGQIAVQSILGEDFDSTAIGQWRGTLIPDQELRTWLMPLYHPSYPNRDTKNANLQAFYDHDLARALNHMQQHMNKDFPIYEDGQSEVDIVYDYNQILSLLESINNDENLVVVDYETTGLKPYIPGHRIATVSLSYKDRAIAFPYEYGSFFAQQQRLRIKRGLRRIWKNANIRKVAHNAKFEHIWTKKILDCEPVNWYWCTMQGAHIQDNRQKWSALKFQTYINFGQKTWSGDVDGYLKGFPFNKIDQAPLDKLLLYNGLDVHWTKQLLEKQELFYEKNPKLKKAFDLFNEGSIVLGDVQSNGVPVDEEYCYAERKRYQRRIDVIERSIYTSNEAQLFKERTGKDFGIKDKDFSDNDLRILFYDILGYTSEKTTEKGEVKSVDEESGKGGLLAARRFASDPSSCERLHRPIARSSSANSRRCLVGGDTDALNEAIRLNPKRRWANKTRAKIFAFYSRRCPWHCYRGVVERRSHTHTYLSGIQNSLPSRARLWSSFHRTLEATVNIYRLCLCLCRLVRHLRQAVTMH